MHFQAFLKKNYLNTVAVFIGLLTFYSLAPLLFPPPVQVEVEALITSGQRFEVYINDDFVNLGSLPILQNIRHTYLFPMRSLSVDTIRLDPSDLAGSQSKIFSVKITQGMQSLLIPAQDILKWKTNDAQIKLSLDHTYVIVEGKSNDPFIQTHHLGFQTTNKLSHFQNRLVHWNQYGFFFICAFLFIILFGSKKSWVYVLPLLTLACVFKFIGPLLASQALKLLSPILTPPSIRYSVGRSSWLGYSKLTDKIIYFLTLGLMACAGWMMTCFKTLPSPSTSELPSNKKSVLPLLLIIVFYALATFPNLTEIYKSIVDVQHRLDFDSSNILTWQYSIHKGWLPFKDFWYPYGGQANQSLPFPWDALRAYFHQLIVVSIFLTCVFELIGRNAVWILLLFVSFLQMCNTDLILASNRYFLSLDGCLLFLTAIRFSGQPFLFAAFGAFSGWALLYEPNQLIYMGPGVLLIALIHLKECPSNKDRILFFKNLILSLIIFTIIAISFIFSLASNQQLEGFISFYGRMASMANHSSHPTSILTWYNLHLNPENTVFLMVNLLVGICTYFYFIDRKKLAESSFESKIFIGIAAVSVVSFMKQLIRPHIANHLIGLPIVAIFFFMFRWSNLWNKKQFFTGCFFCGCILGLGTTIGGLQSTFTNALSTVRRASNNLTILSASHQGAPYLDHYFDSKHLLCSDAYCSHLLEWIASLKARLVNNRIFVLGDQSYFYIAANQKPPKYITFYDGSHIESQREVIRWIDNEKIDYVLWDTSVKEFDLVPNEVRAPIIFNYIIKNYIPYKAIGHYQILKRGAFKNDFADFWRSNLGTTIDLGYLPQSSSLRDSRECSQESEICVDALEISNSKLSSLDQRISFSVQGKSYQIAFKKKTAVEIVYIPLNRVWFWQAFKQLGLSAELLPDQTPGTSIKLIKKELNFETLY